MRAVKPEAVDQIKARATVAIEASKKRIERLAELMRAEMESLHGCDEDEYWKFAIDHEAHFVMLGKKFQRRVE